jgi:hypothetical protein
MRVLEAEDSEEQDGAVGPVERPGEVAANGYQVIAAALPGPVAGVDVATAALADVR